jgi:hypothetical protein
MPEYEVNIKLWIIDDDEESIAQMCKDVARGFEETVSLDYQFHGIDRSAARSGLINVSFHEVFSNKEESCIQ